MPCFVLTLESNTHIIIPHQILGTMKVAFKLALAALVAAGCLAQENNAGKPTGPVEGIPDDLKDPKGPTDGITPDMKVGDHTDFRFQLLS